MSKKETKTLIQLKNQVKFKRGNARNLNVLEPKKSHFDLQNKIEIRKYRKIAA